MHRNRSCEASACDDETPVLVSAVTDDGFRALDGVFAPVADPPDLDHGPRRSVYLGCHASRSGTQIQSLMSTFTY